MTRVSILALCLALAGPAYAGREYVDDSGITHGPGPDVPGQYEHEDCQPEPQPEPERPEPTKAERPDREGCQYDRCTADFGFKARRVVRTGMDR